MTPNQIRDAWNQALRELTPLAAERLRNGSEFQFVAPNKIVARFAKRDGFQLRLVEQAGDKVRFENALSAVVGGAVKVEFKLVEAPAEVEAAAVARGPSKQELKREKSQLPFVRKALELYDARLLDVEQGE